MATSTTDVVKNNAADYMNAVLAKAQAGRLKPHEANVAAAVMAGYYNWTEAISKRELVERAGAIVEAAHLIAEQGEAQMAKANELRAQTLAPKTNGRRKTPASK
jgi:hypothetical protein